MVISFYQNKINPPKGIVVGFYNGGSGLFEEIYLACVGFYLHFSGMSQK